jgi:hypothetical protein
VRDAVGPKVKLMLDANQGWDVSTAIQASNRMYDLDITCYSVRDDQFADCLWEGLFPVSIEGYESKASVSDAPIVRAKSRAGSQLSRSQPFAMNRAGRRSITARGTFATVKVG